MSMFTRADELIKSGKMPHAVILEGRGAEALADFIASALVCAGQSRPCGVCSHCVKSKGNNHPDIIRCKGTGVSGALSISQIRDLKVDAYIKPNEADKKVYILYSAEKMLIPAQNALLKLLEEPPQSVTLLLLCEEKKGLLETVLSRAVLLPANDEVATEQTMADEMVQDIINSLLLKNELELLKATYPLIQDKKLLSETLGKLNLFFREVYICKATKNSDDERVKDFAQKITMQMALDLCDAIAQIIDANNKNANKKLNVTRLCAALRRAVCK